MARTKKTRATPASSPVNVRLDGDLYREVKEEARHAEISIAAWIHRTLFEALPSFRPQPEALPLHPLLQALPQLSRERAKRLAKALDMPELSVLALAIADLYDDRFNPPLDDEEDFDPDDDDGEIVPRAQPSPRRAVGRRTG